MSIVELSVVLPLFGDHQAIQMLPAVCQAWLAQDVPCEVVIGVAAGTEIPPVAGDRVRVVRAKEALTAPGPLRNIAAAAARAPALYLSDGDVAPLGRDFARQALELPGDKALVQPWMYRLVNPADPAASSSDRLLERPRGRVSHVSVDAEGRLIPVGGERFRWLSSGLLQVEPPPGFGWRYEDQTPCPAFPFHWGGISVRRETFAAVGGYCARYSGWGCEDDDLIAKLEERVGVIYAYRAHARALSCLHYEHPRTHTATHFPANHAILIERLAAGVDAMIKEDAR